MNGIIVKDSKISGKGLFAARDFKMGEVIVPWNVMGSYSRGEGEKLPMEQKKRLTFIGDGRYGLTTEPACFMNHSCNPNTHAVGQADIASRDIKLGEEITTSYLSEDAGFVWFDCRCGSLNCKSRVG